MSFSLPNLLIRQFFVCLFLHNSPRWARTSSFLRFLDHTQRRTTVGRTPLDEGSARRRGLSLTTHNTHNRQTSMPPVGFEPTISADERPQIHALDCADTGIDSSPVQACLTIIIYKLTQNLLDNQTGNAFNWLHTPVKYNCLQFNATFPLKHRLV